MNQKIKKALDYAFKYSQHDGGHHKMWCIDQMVRALLECPIETKTVKRDGVVYSFEEQGESNKYKKWIKEYCNGEDGPETYEWDEGIPP